MSVIHTDPLQGLVLITSDLRIWSGGVKLTREEDLSSVRDQLPPTGMVTDGRKNLVKPQALAPFHAIRKRLERLLSRQGFRLMADAFAVPDTEIDQLIREIDAMEQEFNDLIPDFLVNLPRHYSEQAAEYPEWKEQLKNGELSANDIASRMRFSVGIYKIAPPDPDNAGSKLNRQYTNVVNSAVPALLNDVAGKAKDLLKGPIGKKLVCTQAHHAQVRKLVERLSAFSFLDHRVGPSADALTSMLDCIPLNGPLTAGSTAVLRVVVEQLSDPDGILQELDAGQLELDITPEAQAPAMVPVVSPVTPAQQAYVGV